jgi:hypothetical protein
MLQEYGRDHFDEHDTGDLDEQEPPANYLRGRSFHSAR